MQLSEPILAVSPSLHGRVLAVLARTDRPLTGRTVASLVQDGSTSGVQKTLDDLVRNGVVIAQPAGRAKLHSLNKEHVAYPAVNALAHLREGLIERISAEVDTWELEATAVWLFGSAARGDGDSRSDVDIFVVRPAGIDGSEPAWSTQLDTLADRVTQWSGNGCELLEFGVSEFQDFVDRGERLVMELRSDAVPLAGAGPRSLLNRTDSR